MLSNIPLETVETAAARLAKTDRGLNTMRHVLRWLDDDGLGLDGRNKQAILILIQAAFGQHPMTARDLMRQYLGE